MSKTRRSRVQKAREWVRRGLGVVLCASGGLGILLAIAGLAALPWLTGRATLATRQALQLATQEATALAGTLSAAGQALLQAADSLRQSQEALGSFAATLEDAAPFVESTSGFLVTRGPRTIDSARLALISATSGAQAIDRVLQVLAFFGPLTGVSYDRDHPLDEGLAQVAESLTPLPGDLRSLGRQLEPLALDLTETKESLEGLAVQVDLLATDLEAVEHELAIQQAFLLESAAGLDRVESGISRSFSLAAAGMALVLLWIAIGQFAVIQVGRDMLSQPAAERVGRAFRHDRKAG